VPLTCDQDHDYRPEQQAFNHGLMNRFLQHTQVVDCSPPEVSRPHLVMDYYSHAPRRPSRVGQTCGRAVAYLPDVRTLASHTTAGTVEPIRPPGYTPRTGSPRRCRPHPG
jgi:hypothetical protein